MPGRPWSASTARPLSSASAGRPDEVRRLARFQIGIVDERVADFLGLGEAELGGADAGDAERREQLLDFPQLAGIVGGDDQLVADRPHRPTAFNCAAKISSQPMRARRSSRSRPSSSKRLAFGGQLRLDDRAVGGEHEIAVAAGRLSSIIIEVEHRRALVDAAADRGDLGADRVVGERFGGEQLVDRDAQRDPGAGDGRGARAAVGLDDVAIDDDLALAELRQVDHGAQASGRSAAGFPASGPIACPWPPRGCRGCGWRAGSMPYSAVTQPWPLPRRNGGTLSSTEAVTSTRVSPKLTRQEPSAWRVKPGSKRSSRIWSGARPTGAHTGKSPDNWCGRSLDRAARQS